MHWVPFAFFFRATTPLTTLTIEDVTGLDPLRGTALDGLSVTLAGDQSPPAAPPVVTPAVLTAGAPAAPTGLAVTAVTADRASLTWIDNSGNETAIAIWRRDSSGTWSRVGVVPPNTTTFTDTGLTPGTPYTYRVRARNAARPGRIDQAIEIPPPDAVVPGTKRDGLVVGAA